MNTELPTEAERAAVLAGLAELKRRGPKMTSPKNAAHVRTQLYLAPDEHAALKVLGHTLAFHVGRRVAQTLTVRLALSRLADDAKRSLSDPVAAARMKADLLSVRAERFNRG